MSSLFIKTNLKQNHIISNNYNIIVDEKINNFYFISDINDHIINFSVKYEYHEIFPLLNIPLIVECVGVSRIDGYEIYKFICTVSEYRNKQINYICN